MNESISTESQALEPVAAEPVDTRFLSDKLPLWLRLAQRAALARVNGALNRYELLQIHYLIMGLVRDNPGCRQISIARALEMKQPNVAAIVQMLVDRDLISRTTDPTDRRANRLDLTVEGARCLSDLDLDYSAVHDELVSKAGAEPGPSLVDMLRRLALGFSDENAPSRRLKAPARLPPIEVPSSFFGLPPDIDVSDASP